MQNTKVSSSEKTNDATPNKTDDGKNPLGRPLTIVFCIPGNTFSNNFLKSWSSLLLYCITHQINPILSSHTSSNVHFVRNMCLGANDLRGESQKPFDDKINYDFIMWIDSDQVFNVNQFISLLKHDIDVVSGLYLMNDGKNYTVVRKWDNSTFLNKGRLDFLNRDTLITWLDENAEGDIKENKDEQGRPYKDYTNCKIPLMKVDYTGLGWTLIKKGVIEKLEYPWFYGTRISMNNDVSVGDDDDVTEPKKIVTYTSEDVTFFLNLKKKGIDSYVDPRVFVGNEKKIIL